jgi:hypothetical protein
MISAVCIQVQSALRILMLACYVCTDGGASGWQS